MNTQSDSWLQMVLLQQYAYYACALLAVRACLRRNIIQTIWLHHEGSTGYPGYMAIYFETAFARDTPASMLQHLCYRNALDTCDQSRQQGHMIAWLWTGFDVLWFLGGDTNQYYPE